MPSTGKARATADLRPTAYRLARTSLALLLTAALATTAPAITIDLELDDEGENPSYDPLGTQMYNVVRAAADMWESLLLGSDSYSFQIEWDDDIGSGTLGLSTQPGGGLEFNPNVNWYFDLTPFNNSEFDFDDADVNDRQTLYRELTPTQQSAWFNGSPPDLLEIGFGGPARPGSLADGKFDLFTVALHELGHSLGINSGEIDGDYEIESFHLVGIGGVELEENGDGHLFPPTALMFPSGAPGERVLPSAAEVMAIAYDEGIANIDLARKDFGVTSGAWNTAGNWLGNRVPDAADDVWVRRPTAATPATATMTGNAVATNLTISEGGNVLTGAFDLVVGERILVTGLDSDLFISASGEAFADVLEIEDTAEVEIGQAGHIVVENLVIEAGAQLQGTAGSSSIEVNNFLRNDGAIRADGNSVLNFFSTNANPYNLDGLSGNGILDALDGSMNFVTGTHSGSFGGVMQIGAGRVIDIRDWAFSGAEIELEGGTGTTYAELAGTKTVSAATFANTTVAVDGSARMSLPTTWNAGAVVTFNDADSTLVLGANVDDVVIYQGGQFGQFNGPGTLVQNGHATARGGLSSIRAERFDWDGAGATPSHTTVEAGGSLTILSGEINDPHNGVITIHDWLTVDTANWTMAGRLNMMANGSLRGSAMATLAGEVVVDGAAFLNADHRFLSTARVSVPDAADELWVSGATIFAGGQYSGRGVIKQRSDATVTANTSIGVNFGAYLAPGVVLPGWVGTYEWDGDAVPPEFTVNEGVGFTVNAERIAADPANDGYDGTLHVNGGTLLVNTGQRIYVPPNPPNPPVGTSIPMVVAPAPWRLDGVMNLQQSGASPAVVASSVGSLIDVRGTVNALAGASTMQLVLLQGGTVNVRSGATLTMQSVTAAGTLDVDLGGVLRLSGATMGAATSMIIEGDVETTGSAAFQGGSYTGNGLLALRAITSIAATTSTNVDTTFGATSTTTIAAGAELRFNRLGVVGAGAVVNGPGLLRNHAPSRLVLNDNAIIGAQVVNEGQLSFGFANPGPILSVGDATVAQYVQTATGSLSIDLAATSFDALAVTGQATLGGALAVQLFGSFMPTVGQSFQILSAGSRLSTFASTQLPPLVAGRAWNVVYGSNFVRLDVVAAPSFTADFDGDNDVDAADLGQWYGDFGVNDFSDADDDGDSDGHDFLAWQRQFGSGPAVEAGTDAVPEPTTTALLAGGLLSSACSIRSRRRRGLLA